MSRIEKSDSAIATRNNTLVMSVIGMMAVHLRIMMLGTISIAV